MSDRKGPVVVARAEDGAQAQIWVDMLRDEGIDATSFEQGIRGSLGGASGFHSRYLILVRREQFGEARSVIAEAGGATNLAELPAEDGASASMTRALLIAGAGAGLFLLLFLLAGR